jgi:hypothetical protein
MNWGKAFCPACFKKKKYKPAARKRHLMTKKKRKHFAEQMICYSLRPIILFVNMDVSRLFLVVYTSVLAKSNMSRREYKIS